MSTAPLAVTVLTAHEPDGAGGPAVAAWALEHLARHAELRVELLVVAELDLPWTYPGRGDARVRSLRRRLDAADAFVVVTPEYNHSFPGNLKQTIDLARDEWARKPVGLVSYGGVSGGLRASEQLRLVFAELRAVDLRDTVSFVDPRSSLDDAGGLRPSPRADEAMATLVDELVWWGRTLRAARAARGRAA